MLASRKEYQPTVRWKQRY
ncbi:hypothetical protein PIIN_10669 [Serendipita indica DSM 11827]|uniref:Uncharacterized protein n=1 Tax=Serendipita indica (strain DSM 11827) TaxID=1109443 RepID=G4TZD7_SERID|nr:hypothetical protein PIIN_10669 [Serendipita indica DSM 11827]